jgi:hypothetical protein
VINSKDQLKPVDFLIFVVYEDDDKPLGKTVVRKLKERKVCLESILFIMDDNFEYKLVEHII